MALNPRVMAFSLCSAPEGLSFEVTLIALSEHSEPPWAPTPAPHQSRSLSAKGLFHPLLLTRPTASIPTQTLVPSHSDPHRCLFLGPSHSHSSCRGSTS